MTNYIEQELAINGLGLHCYGKVSGKPPLVFVHGFTDNGMYWTRTMQTFEATHDTFTYDARGHGLSFRAGGQFNEEDRVNDLIAVIEGLKIHRPGLVGHSMGGATIAQMAAVRPDVPRFLILEDPAWWEWAPGSEDEGTRRIQEHEAMIKNWRIWLETVQNLPRQQALEMIRNESPDWSEQDANLSLNARLQFENDLLNYFPPEQMPWHAVVQQIQCPFLLVIGETARGGILTPEIAEEAVRLSKAGSWVQIKNAGHSIRFDQFDAYHAAVQDFIGRVEAGKP